jgi:hypothetical protein
MYTPPYYYGYVVYIFDGTLTYFSDKDLENYKCDMYRYNEYIKFNKIILHQSTIGGIYFIKYLYKMNPGISIVNAKIFEDYDTNRRHNIIEILNDKITIISGTPSITWNFEDMTYEINSGVKYKYLIIKE